MPPLLQQPLRLLIDGQWVGCASGARMDVINPSTGEVLAQEALGGAVDSDVEVGVGFLDDYAVVAGQGDLDLAAFVCTAAWAVDVG